MLPEVILLILRNHIITLPVHSDKYQSMNSCTVIINAVPGCILDEQWITDVLRIGNDGTGCHSSKPDVPVGSIDAVMVGLHDIRLQFRAVPGCQQFLFVDTEISAGQIGGVLPYWNFMRIDTSFTPSSVLSH